MCVSLTLVVGVVHGELRGVLRVRGRQGARGAALRLRVQQAAQVHLVDSCTEGSVSARAGGVRLAGACTYRADGAGAWWT